jgi:hypothetical protein
MKRLVLLFLVLSLNGISQVDSVYTGLPEEPQKKQRNTDWMQRLTWGGNFQAWLGNPTFIFLSPTVGYIPLKNLHVGVGFIYSYSSGNTGFGRYNGSAYGPHSYIRYVIADSYFIQTEFNRLNQPDLLSFEPGSRLWINYWLVGGGFRQRVSDKAAMTTSIMYNLTPHMLSVFPSRLILQFGFTSSF